MREKHAINSALTESIHHDFHSPNQVRQLWLIANLGRFRNNVYADPLKKPKALLADNGGVDFHALRLPIRHGLYDLSEKIDI